MNRLKLSMLGAAAAIPAASLLFASAAGPNLLQNGDFSNGVTGWSDFAGDPQAVNGAMQLTNAYQGTGNSYYSALQCVTGIQEGVHYTVKGDAYIEPGQTPFGAAGLYLHFHVGDNCDGQTLGGGHTANGFDEAQRGYWLPLSHGVTAPAGAKSVYVRPTALKEPKPSGTSAPETLVVLFDNIEFFETNVPVDPTPEPEPPVDDPAPEPDPSPEPEDEPASEPEEEPVPAEPATPDDPADEPQETPEEPQVPEVPEVPQVPETPEVPELPAPGGEADEPADVPHQPEPEAPSEDPVPEQPTTPEQPAPGQPQSHDDAPAAPVTTVPLPPATGNGPAMTDPSALGTIISAIGAGLAAVGSAAAAAATRRR